MDAVRVLPAVERVDFDIPTETFTVRLRAGADAAAVLATITDLGYAPEVLSDAPGGREAITHLRQPTSAAVREALARARARSVPLFVDVGGPFCRLCRTFEETSMEDERVRAKLASFELLRIDVEQDEAAAKDLDVHGVPDLWVLDGEGRVLARHNGYLEPAALLTFLESVTR